MLLTHVPLCPGSCKDVCLVWNYAEVLAVLARHACVVAVLAGHDHDGGYARDAAGVHHLTFPSPLNATEECREAHARIDFYADRMEVYGAGGVAQRIPAMLKFLKS